MNINDILGQMGGLQSMAKELGVSESQARSGAAALLPAILGGFKKQTQSSGLDGLGGLLGQLDARHERRRQSAGRHSEDGRQSASAMDT